MGKFNKIAIPTYDLSKNWITTSGYSYNLGKSLYAWYQFDHDISTAGDILDRSKNNLSLSPLDPSVDRPPAPVGVVPFGRAPAGFPKKSTNLSDECLANSDTSKFLFSDGSTDQPFSVGFWIKFDDVDSTAEWVINKRNGTSNSTSQWSVVRHTDSSLYMIIYDSSGYSYRYTNTGVSTGVWYHIVATYDGRGGNTAFNGMQLYMNGINVSGSGATVNSYTAMNPQGSSIFSIASPRSYPLTGQSTDAHFLEVAVWTKVLTLDNVKALYEGPDKKLLGKLISGVVNNPPRTRIIENDFRTGSYPTNLRTGDKDFRGNTTVNTHFDDTKSIDFTSPFPQAQINILGGAESINRHWIGLTSSLGNYTQEFEFMIGHSASATDTALRESATLVYLDSPVTSYASTFAGIPTLGPASGPKGAAVYLVGLVPVTGSFVQGNKIATGSFQPSPTRFKINQFKITSGDKARYPNLLNIGSRYENKDKVGHNSLPDITAYTSICLLYTSPSPRD